MRWRLPGAPRRTKSLSFGQASPTLWRAKNQGVAAVAQVNDDVSPCP
jgi:hypothetical protein